MAELIVRAQDVTKVYRMGHEEVHALRGITLDIFRGEYLSIMGPSGSGKSTFFNMVGGLDLPSTGDVIMEGYRLRQISAAQLAWVRCHKMGYIFQSFNLVPTMTALENVAIPAIFAGKTPEEANEDAARELKLVGLGHRMDHLPGQVSGGQQQRIAIARALVNKPAIILADEPTGNLDLKTGEEIIKLFDQLKTERNITIVAATHDLKMLNASDRVVWIKDGKVERVAKKGEIEIEVGSIDGQEAQH